MRILNRKRFTVFVLMLCVSALGINFCVNHRVVSKEWRTAEYNGYSWQGTSSGKVIVKITLDDEPYTIEYSEGDPEWRVGSEVVVYVKTRANGDVKIAKCIGSVR